MQLNVQFVPDMAVARRIAIRDRISEFEDRLSKHPSAVFGDNEGCPLKHDFVDGIYVREIRIPAGTVLTGKIHRHAHPNFLVSGTAEVVTEHGGRETLAGPLWMISKAGTKRVVVAVTDLVWITVHRTDALTPEEAESEIICPDFEEINRKELCLG